MDQATPDDIKHGSNVAGVPVAVEMVALAMLLSAPRQLRKRSLRQLKRLARSISEFGFLVPVLIDKDNRVIAGQGRIDAAKLLGLTVIPCIRVEHLTPAQLRLFAIADNELPKGIEYIPGALVLELKEIQLLEPEADLTSSGLSIYAIDTAFGRDRTEELAEHADALPPPEPVVISTLGDLWQLGRHVLGCGDARDATFIAKMLGGQRVRIMLSDAPWNLKIEGVVSGKGKKKHVDFVMGAGEMSRDEFIKFLRDAIAAAQSVLIDGALLYLFIDWRTLDQLDAAAAAQDFEKKNLLVWCKDNAGLGGLYRSQHELIGRLCQTNLPHAKRLLAERNAPLQA